MNKETLESLQADLPEVFRGKKYIDESAFLEDLEPFSDLHIVLNEDGFAVWQKMPGNAHNSAVKMIIRRFATWKRESGCDNVEDYAAPNMLTTRSYNPKKKGSGERHPDFSIYGPDRLKPSGSILNHDVPGKSGKHVENPHVVIQFGWANPDDYEEYAIDDIMNYTGVGKYELLKPPNVAYLIKAQGKGEPGRSPCFGFNIYEVRHTERRRDVNPTLYRVGVTEDLVVSISAADMGVETPAEGEAIAPFTIDVHAIRQSLEEDEYALFEADE